MKQRSPMAFIFLTVFIDLLGAGIVLPLLPFYVKLVEQSGDGWVAAHAALVVGALGASFSLMQFLFTPVLGALSDRYGRRPVLLLSLLGSGIGYIIFGIAERFNPLGAGVVLIVLFAARILDGITGGNISTAQAYIADITPPEERAKSLGLIGAAFGLGFMLGPAVGGLLATVDLTLPAYAAAALAIGNTIFGYFRLPESLPPERRTNGALALNPFRRVSGLLRRTEIRTLLIGVLLLNLAFAGLQNNFGVFADKRFGYGPSDYALVLAFLGLCAVFVQGFLIRKLLPVFGEARLAVVGLTVQALAYGLIVVSTAGWQLYPIVGLLALGSGMTTPSLTGLISRRVSAQEQGSTLGGVQALTSLTMVAGFLFDRFGTTAPYAVGALLVVLAAAVTFGALRPALSSGAADPVQAA